MKKTTYIWCRFLGIASFCTIVSSNVAVSAQVTPDNTLPNNSEVKVEGNKSTIEGGTTAGSNLFHSFEKFGVRTGGEAHFNNAADIQNIIGRVTGKSISEIDGLIKANGSANLFLINPNGIVFGENARLDIGGSFFGTSADSMKFGNDIEFSAKNPQSKPLLTMNVPVGLQYGANPGNIQVKGDGQGLREESDPIIDTQSGLRVQPNQTLALVGGDVSLEGATLKTAGGRIELGSVKGGEGLVNLTPTEKGFSLGYDAVETGGNIELSEQAAVDASGEGGDVQVWGKNIKVTDGSVIEASTLGLENGGDLVVNAQESVELIGTSNSQSPNGLFALVYPEATGKGGDLTVNAQKLLVREVAQVGANTLGKGKGGDLTVNAQHVQLIGISKDGQVSSGLFASAQPNSTGDAGDLAIKTYTLQVKDGAVVSTSTFGEGKGGNLSVNAQDVQLIGMSKDGQTPSRLRAAADKNSTGDAGDLTIQTNTLLVKDGAQVGANTFSEGKGGNLSVNAQDVQLIGTNKDGQISSALSTSSQPSATKDGTEVIIDPETLDTVLGDAGNLTINADSLLVKDGAQVGAATFGEGKGGNLTVNAQDVQLIGKLSELSTSALSDSTGDAGDLTIKTNTLLVRDGAEVGASTSGKGKGGNLTVNAQDVQLIGKSSQLSTSALPDSTGDAGDLTIKSNTLLVRDGALVITATLGEGNGGNITVDAQGVQVIGSKDGEAGSGLLTSALDLTGDAGDLNINTNTLQLEKAWIGVDGFTTEGTAGKLTINADSIRLNNYALLTANTRSNKVDPETEQATININSQELIMRRSSNITTNAQGENVVGGNINIDTDFLIANENSDISANSENFRGGNVKIDAQGIFGTQFRPQSTPQSDITATGASEDLSGTVEIITPETDPTSGSIESPTIPVDTEIVDACSTPGYAQSSFTITGTGSLPPSPFEALTGSVTRTRLATLEGDTKPQRRRRKQPRKEEPQIKRIEEARGWVRTKDGKIILVPYATQKTNFQAQKNSGNCKLIK